MRFFVIAFMVLVATSVNAQTQSVQEACNTVGVACDYNSRYGIIDLVFTASGQVVFDKQSNPYTRDKIESTDLISKIPRYYIGTVEQNRKLARNIIANKELFKNGKLSVSAAKKWKVVP